jgi:hypothetical protein
MQHILHDYTHTQRPSHMQCTPHTDTDPGEDSERNNGIEEVGISEAGAEVGRSGGTEGFHHLASDWAGMFLGTEVVEVYCQGVQLGA